MPLVPESQIAFWKAKRQSAAGSVPSLAADASPTLSRFDVAQGLQDEAVSDGPRLAPRTD